VRASTSKPDVRRSTRAAICDTWAARPSPTGAATRAGASEIHG
jgi:hypothetical protein